MSNENETLAVGWAKYQEEHPFAQTEKDAFEAGWRFAQMATEAAAPEPGLSMAERIYYEYPRKVGRDAAIKAIKKAAIGKTWLYLLGKTQAYAAAVSRWPAEDTQYVPHPATWFNRGSYDDNPKEWVRGVKPGTPVYRSTISSE